MNKNAIKSLMARTDRLEWHAIDMRPMTPEQRADTLVEALADQAEAWAMHRLATRPSDGWLSLTTTRSSMRDGSIVVHCTVRESGQVVRDFSTCFLPFKGDDASSLL